MCNLQLQALRQQPWGTNVRQFWAVLVTVLSLVSGSLAADGPADLVAEYVQFVLAGDTKNVAALWAPDYLATCARLGIEYAESTAPFDLASPLHTHLSELREGTLRLQIGATDIRGEGFVVPVQLVGGPALPPYQYAVVPVGEGWKLAGQIWATGGNWPRVESEFVTYYCQDEELLTAPARQALDSFVAKTAGLLGLSPSRLADLRQNKILYFLADNATVESLTGYPTKGMAELATGSVISSHFPHFHEVAHLLVNYALQEAPLYPLPLLQEGTACALGGRWGRAPLVIQYMGWVNHSMQLVSITDILTREGFHGAAGGPDATYAASAVLCDLIEAQSGWSALLELQTNLADASGPKSPATIAAEIGRVCGWPTDQPLVTLQEKYEAWVPRFRRGGVTPGLSGLVPPDSAEVGVSVWPGETIVFVVPGGAEPVAVLPIGTATSETHSSLFNEVMRRYTYAGQPAGIRCSASSVSVYDFAANRLVGVWVGDFSAEPEAARLDESRLAFGVARVALPDSLVSLLSLVQWEVVQP